MIGILLLNAYGRLSRAGGHRGRPDRARDPPRRDGGCGSDQPLPAATPRPRPGPDLSAIRRCCRSSSVIAFFAGIAYAFVAIPSQTAAPGGPSRGGPRPRVRRPEHARLGRQLRCRSSSSARSPDWIGTTAVVLLVGLLVGVSGVASILIRGHLAPRDARSRADVHAPRPVRDRAGRGDARGRVRHGRRRRDDARAEPSSPAAGPSRRPVVAADGQIVAEASATGEASRAGDPSATASDDPDPPARELTVARVAVVFTGGTISMRRRPGRRRQRAGPRRRGDPGPDPGPRRRSPTSSPSTAA